MPRKKIIEPFYLIITDRDKGKFNIVGPMTDDTEWNQKVCLSQENGRHVNCQTGNQALTEEQLINEVAKRGRGGEKVNTFLYESTI